MGLTLHEVVSSEEFPAVVDCEREAYKTPFNAFDILYTPQGLDPIATRDAVIKEQWASHAKSPTSHWLKVVDSDTGNVAGAAQWHIHETDPFARPEDHHLDAVWWPEGERSTMRRPCLEKALAICFVRPGYRRRGIGNMLVEWGTKKADKLHVEAFVEATDDGRPLYARHGFHFMNLIVLDGKIDEPSEQWKALAKELRLPIVVHAMWRPIGGKFVDGETVIPWET
ncbi:hypothetical protein MMC11_002186 [Xylographa trunciseda]|nr:hypothetical protein [Xylographa trunciseda]